MKLIKKLQHSWENMGGVIKLKENETGIEHWSPEPRFPSPISKSYDFFLFILDTAFTKRCQW